MREILPYPSTLLGSSPLPSSYLVLTTFKRNHRNHRNHDRFSYYLKFSAIPLREHVKFLSRHTRWVAGSTALSAYRFLHKAILISTSEAISFTTFEGCSTWVMGTQGCSPKKPSMEIDDSPLQQQPSDMSSTETDVSLV